MATIAYLVNSGKVRLCGTFAGATIDLATSTTRVNPFLTHHSKIDSEEGIYAVLST